MKFKNKPNKCHEITENGNKRLIWESRSVAVNCIVVLKNNLCEQYVLVSERGPNAADFVGKLNLISGYLDWNESGTDAVYREAWEECGINLPELINNSFNVVIKNNLNDPWEVETTPNENRQNISLRYGVILMYNHIELPHLSTEHNEIKGEVEKSWWMPITDIDNYQWAFSHDKVIKKYLKI